MLEAYGQSVAALLELGEAEPTDIWPDYCSDGLSAADVPDLIRMALDPTLYEADAADPAYWAPIHAWRALGQLQAADAAAPLVQLLDQASDNEWVMEEMPQVLAMIGAPALAPLAEKLADANADLDSRITASDALAVMPSLHPDTRDLTVAILVDQLARFAENDRILNAFVITHLTDLGEIEAASLMQQAFDAGVVALDIGGDWEEVQIRLGLLETRQTPERNWFQAEQEAIGQADSDGALTRLISMDDQLEIAPPGPSRKPQNEKLRKARKAEKVARKQQRKPKKKKRK